MVVDKVDKKIMIELLKNSRLPLKQIGKAVGLGRENVDYRMKQLINKGIINSFITNIDVSKLGFSQYTVFIEYDKITELKEKELIKKILKNKNISWFGINSGKWSVVFDIYAKNNEKLDRLFQKILDDNADIFGDYVIYQVKDKQYFFEKMLDVGTPFSVIEKKNKENIDEKGKKILSLISDNSRLKYTDLISKTGLTANAIKYRIKKMENSIIQNYSISVDHKKLGYQWFGIQLKALTNLSSFKKTLEIYLTNHKKTIFYYHYYKNGTCDYDVGIIIKDISELRSFVNELRTRFHGTLKVTDTFSVLDAYSGHNLPPAVFE